jgi:phospholipid/cholesterol/gamma-HCH transport system ATP-binding protein
MESLKPAEATSWPVEVRGLVASYGDQVVLKNIDFTAPAGEVTAVLGGSGCGKTTLFKHALGLLKPDAGTVKLLGMEIGSLSEAALKALRARIGVLFQGGALFSSMTVGENVAMVIRETARLPEEVVHQMVRMKLSLVRMEDAIGKYPEELSGGMRKRAALARAIATDPDVLFCDEPSAGLDPVVASELDDLLLSLKSLFGMTLVIVTHELESVKKIADRVVMLDDGRVMARGTLDEVMGSDNPIVADFFRRVSRTDEKAASSVLSVIKGD